MARKSKQHKKKTYKKPPPAIKKEVKPVQKAEKPEKKVKHWIPIVVILALTTIVYSTSFQNELIMNWDDAGYIVKNDYIKSLDGESLKAIFTEFYMSNYHPLTTLTYAIEYSIVGEDVFLYHFNNFWMHLVNIILVFFLVKMLIRKGSIWIPTIVALFFAIHPMHVESVAWISERKDMLYTMFFLLGLIQYLKYIRAEKGKLKPYILLFVFFVLSLLSKSAAVVFPVLLFAFDWFERRKWSWMIIIEKIPLVGMSLWFGLMAMNSQEGAMQDLAPMLTLGERLMIVNYSFLTYVWKLLIPVHLSAMYPYPLKENDVLPQIYFILPLATAVLGFLVWKFRKQRELIFGLAFFAITIALVIQLLPVGGTNMSKHYRYLPYIWLLIPLAVWLDRAFKKNKNTLAVIVAVPAILFSIQSFDRVSYWENGDKLFTDVIEKYPKLPYAYNNRGFLYWDHYALTVYPDNPPKEDMYVSKAYQDFTTALSLDPDYIQAWSNRAILLYNIGRVEESLDDFNMVLSIDSLYNDGLIGRANTLSTLKKFEESLPDYNAYLRIKPEDTKAYVWRAIAHANLKHWDQAFADLRYSLTQDQNDYEAWYWMGICHYNQQNLDSAIYYFDRSISLNQNFYEVYAWKALAFHNQGKYEEALPVFAQAISMSPGDPANYVNRAITLYNLSRYDEAMKDLQTAGEMQYPLNREFFMAVQNKDPYLQGKL